MPDQHYPSVDFDFIEQHLLDCGKLAEGGIVKIGSTTTFIVEGQQAIFKRSILVRELEAGEVCFEQATGLALRFGFMGDLLDWLEEHKNWKEGAYIVPQNNNQ